MLGFRLAVAVLLVASVPSRVAYGARVHEGSERVPLFARQTNRMCSACHVAAHYPELTEMGRTFKLNGYRLSKIDSLLGDIEENTAAGRSELLLNLANSLGFMLQTSFTGTKTGRPGTQNGTVLLPDQLSLFLGGRMTPKVGGSCRSRTRGPTGRSASTTSICGTPIPCGCSPRTRSSASR